MKSSVTTLDAKEAGTVELNDAIFGLTPRKDILHRMVRYQLAKRQSGNHATKGRSDVAGTRSKFGQQKGGGSARHGNKTANLFRGGGKTFGPQTRSHAIKLPKKIRALALRHALSAKAQANELLIIDSTVSPEAKTAGLKKQFVKLGLNSVLIVDGLEVDKNFGLAVRNIPDVDVLPVQGINVYDILRRDKLVLTKAAIEGLEARLK